MKKLVAGIILLLLITSQAQALAQRIVDEKELIFSEYGWLGDKAGFGDRYYKVTYDDGTSIIQRIRSGSLLPGYINYAAPRVDIPVGGDLSGKFKVPVLLEGVSCSLSGSTSGNLHYLEFSYVGSGGYNAVIGGLYLIVPCGKVDNYDPYVDNYYIGAIINTPGDYNLKLTETVKLSSGTVVTDNRLFTVRVFGTAGTPTPTPTPASKGTIRVSSNIAAAVYIDGVMKGTTGNSFSVDAGGHDVKVSQSGYTTYTRTVTVDNGATIDVFATLTKIPIGTPTPTPEVGQGSITVNSNVLGVVYIDGINKGATGNTYTVDAGGHDIRVTASGYNSYSTSITVDYGTTKVVDVTLTTAATGGSSGGSTGGSGTTTIGYIKVTSNIPANIEIDNKPVGTTEQVFFTTTVGGHDVKVSQGGYTAYTTQVTITSGATTEVTALLRPTTATATSTPTGTSTIQQESGGNGIVYRGVDITLGADGKYYVGDMKHATIAEARATIDELMASKEQAKSPGFEAVFAIAGLFAVAYLILRQKKRRNR